MRLNEVKTESMARNRHNIPVIGAMCFPIIYILCVTLLVHFGFYEYIQNLIFILSIKQFKFIHKLKLQTIFKHRRRWPWLGPYAHVTIVIPFLGF